MDVSSNNYSFKQRSWVDSEASNIIILAVHGYNDYSKSFENPANLFSKFGIDTFSFDLRGFGSNDDAGHWFPLEVHLKDIDFVIKELIKKHPKKKIFLLGESMGGAILLSLVNQTEKLPIEGIILVAPAIWNFSDSNKFKSLFLKFFSFLFPEFRPNAKGIVKVRPSDNIPMLKEFSNDPSVISKPTLKSLNGIVELMDKSYLYSYEFFTNPIYDTLIIIPGIDEIVPRKPLLKLLHEEKIRNKISEKIFISLHEKNFHMILRDIDGDRVSREIKEWIIKKNEVKNLSSFKNVIQRLENLKFFHILDQ